MSAAINHSVKLYTFPLSGHAHRVRLALSLLHVPTELVEVDLRKGAQKQPGFLALNPFGQVPVIEDQGTVVADSNAILVYLARKYGNNDWLPADPAGEAAVQRWLSVAAGLVAFGPAAARLVTVFGAGFNATEVINRAHGLLKVMDAELTGRDFLLGAKPSIADIANYSYIAHAPEGNVSLADYPHVRAWLARIEALPGFVGMQKTAVGLAA
ncbi:glutathione S-transferase [Paucibacter sp. TC2R-5]|uniref:glutathione S-transferase family protein n=1 Tax=Paucibacter sp. TC2R-5 TaxID=2893555 RepID=UPI0021E3DBC1|nr:glutathione S-transferase [Paucibacter sp. TC2R-5]MCV2360209.1 glutathione S-transferase [Paucibacter sp. TC2R-5]